MGKINVLSFEIANLIAAGEVVERPSSVLKELIENSIDSGATQITAEIRRGGVALIRVSDNGCGISREDLPVAIKRHATSKISEKEDLSSIMTLGFRGEALAAISSVCEMDIITKTRDEESGSLLISEAGNIVEISEVDCADGTTVVVKNLFYNVPARRKFLKKDATEAMNVCALVEKVALSRPDISIQLSVDGEERFRTPGNGSLSDTVYAVFGKDFASKLIEVDGNANGVRCHGFIGRSDNVKKNRNYMNVFINGRYVKSVTAQTAVERAFTSYIAPECFPTCVLFLNMDPKVVDVNVHPAKLECKFSDERAVFETVYYSVKTALEKHEYRPDMELKAKTAVKGWSNPASAFVPLGESQRAEQISFNPTVEHSSASCLQRSPRVYSIEQTRKSSELDKPITVKEKIGFREDQKTLEMSPSSSLGLLEKLKSYKGEGDNNPDICLNVEGENGVKTDIFSMNEDIKPEYKLIGEAFNCYVIIEYQGDLLIIDKHAAHERVIFEDLKKKQHMDQRLASQLLLLPIYVELTPDALAAVGEQKQALEGVGFEFHVINGGVNITAIPDVISVSDAETLFVGMVDDICEGRGDAKTRDDIRRERALYQVACKAAIKGGRKYDEHVIKWLVEKLLSLPDITVCPHGRPVAYRLTKNELDRQFDRLK